LGRSDVARRGHALSLVALLPCPLLLILDLGRPDRFLNMFRVLKLRSPMSLGSWALAAFGPFCALSALSPRRALALVGLPFALFVAGYTGVLLAATAVPLWTKNHLLLGPLFLSSSFSSAAAALRLVRSDHGLARL